MGGGGHSVEAEGLRPILTPVEALVQPCGKGAGRVSSLKRKVLKQKPSCHPSGPTLLSLHFLVRVACSSHVSLLFPELHQLFLASPAIGVNSLNKAVCPPC